MTPRVLPVGAFVFLFRELLEADPLYSDLWLEGEVSDLSRSSAGHTYFSLSDDDGSLKCVLFRRDALRQHQLPQLGAQVAVHGTLSIYPRSGSVQLQADLVRPAGLGAAWLEVERLRQRLQAEGIFDPGRKRSLPAWPTTLGVVTSFHGAAWQDILEVVGRRFPVATLVLASAQVQGSAAVNSIVGAIEMLQRDDEVEVIILARGGGATDDLSAFNDERVVKAVFGSRVPVVTGIGHASDSTLVEDAADLAAPTPSAAAELTVPSAIELGDRLNHLKYRLDRTIRDTYLNALSTDRILALKLRALSPVTVVSDQQSSIESMCRDLRQNLDRLINAQAERLMARDELLRVLSPHAVLRRGYAALQRTDNGQQVGSVSHVESGTHLTATLADGNLQTRVEKVGPAELENSVDS